MTTQIDRIKTKLSDLKNRDKKLHTFGSSNHLYELKDTKTENELAAFESKYGIQLPKGYRDFLRLIGNGGAGPYYGLECLEYALCDDLDSKNSNELIDPTNDFPYTESWNFEFDDSEAPESYKTKCDLYYSKKWITGVLRICNFGCGVFMNIVVKGQEYGNIWVDDRCNFGGIYPDHYFGNKDKIDFLTWYELWLDKSLSALENQITNTRNIMPNAEQTWWQKLLGLNKH